MEGKYLPLNDQHPNNFKSRKNMYLSRSWFPEVHTRCLRYQSRVSGAVYHAPITV